MKTPFKPNDTHEQLRAIMQRHTATIGAGAPLSGMTSNAPVMVTAVKITPPVSHAATPRAAVPVPVAKKVERSTVCLSMAEVARVDAIILETHQRTGKPITTSDVLRIGIRRVGEHAPITSEEIATLRANDGRRSRNKQPV